MALHFRIGTDTNQGREQEEHHNCANNTDYLHQFMAVFGKEQNYCTDQQNNCNSNSRLPRIVTFRCV